MCATNQSTKEVIAAQAIKPNQCQCIRLCAVYTLASAPYTGSSFGAFGQYAGAPSRSLLRSDSFVRSLRRVQSSRSLGGIVRGAAQQWIDGSAAVGRSYLSRLVALESLTNESFTWALRACTLRACSTSCLCCFRSRNRSLTFLHCTCPFFRGIWVCKRFENLSNVTAIENMLSKMLARKDILTVA